MRAMGSQIMVARRGSRTGRTDPTATRSGLPSARWPRTAPVAQSPPIDAIHLDSFRIRLTRYVVFHRPMHLTDAKERAGLMSGAQLYDTIGAAYTVTRRTEPRIAEQVWAALG